MTRPAKFADCCQTPDRIMNTSEPGRSWIKCKTCGHWGEGSSLGVAMRNFEATIELKEEAACRADNGSS